MRCCRKAFASPESTQGHTQGWGGDAGQGVWGMLSTALEVGVGTCALGKTVSQLAKAAALPMFLALQGPPTHCSF